MHHEKLDVIVFAIDLEINQGKEESAVKALFRDYRERQK